MVKVKVNGIDDSFQPVGISQLGTVVFDNVLFPAGSWFNLDGEELFYDDVKLDSVSVVVNRKKHIVKTMIEGRKGTVKEYIASMDYEIEINAIIAPDIYSAEQLAQIAGSNTLTQAGAAFTGFTAVNEPNEQIEALARLDNVEDRVAIECKFLQNNFNVNYVVIENIKLTRLGSDSWTLKMNVISDDEIDLGAFG